MQPRPSDRGKARTPVARRAQLQCLGPAEHIFRKTGVDITSLLMAIVHLVDTVTLSTSTLEIVKINRLSGFGHKCKIKRRWALFLTAPLVAADAHSLDSHSRMPVGDNRSHFLFPWPVFGPE